MIYVYNIHHTRAHNTCNCSIVLILRTAIAKLQIVDVSCKYIMQYRKLYNLKHRLFFTYHFSDVVVNKFILIYSTRKKFTFIFSSIIQ